MVNLTALRTRARAFADMPGTHFVADSELDVYLQYGSDELHTILLSLKDDYALESATVTPDSNGRITLPTDFYSLRFIGYESSGRLTPIPPYGLNDYSKAHSVCYRVTSEYIQIYPFETTDALHIIYVSRGPVLSTSTSNVDERRRHDEFIALSAAIRMKLKEEADPSGVIMLKQQCEEYIRKDMKLDRASPAMVTDTRPKPYGNTYPRMRIP